MVEESASPIHGYQASAAIYGLMLLIIVYIGRIQELIPQLNNLSVGKVIFALNIILLAVSPRERSWWSTDTPQVKYVLGILGLMLATVPFSMWPGGSLGFITDVHVKTVLLFFLVLAAVTRVKDIEYIVWAIVWSVAMLGTAVLLNDQVGRSAASSTYDPNDIAYVMVTLLPVVYFFMRSKHGIAKITLVAVLMTMMAATMATASRGGIVGFVVVAGIIFAKQGWNIRRVLLPLLVVGVVIAYAGSETFWERMSTMTNLEEDYNVSAGGGRLVIWKQGLKMMLRHPLTGVGLNAFEVAEGGSHGGRGKWNAAHNSFIQIGAELGFLGLFLFGRLLLTSVRSIRACRVDGDRKPVPDWIIDGTEVAVYGYLATGFFLSQAYSSVLYLLIALTVLARKFCTIVPEAAAGLKGSV